MNLDGKIIFITNRNVRSGVDDHRLFGDDLNEKGGDDLNLALVEPRGEGWKFELLTDPDGGGDPENPVSRQVFEGIMDLAETNPDRRRWALFVHGFNQSIVKNLKKCQELAAHGLNVIIFSWPSNPGPNADRILAKLAEYKRAQRNARRSVLALERVMEKVCGHIDELTSDKRQLQLALVVHSLGNFLLEEYVRSRHFNRNTRAFDTILLNQADADNKDHAEWVETLTQDSRVCVTINESDKTLALSKKINGSRLGNTLRRLDARDVTYMDFTGGKGVGKSHRPWNEPGKDNPAVHGFFLAVFHGRRGEQVPGWISDGGGNVFRLEEREPPVIDDGDGNPFLNPDI